MDREEVEVDKNAKKDEAMQYPDILTEQALSTTDLSWPKREHFSYGTNARYPERARMAWVASKNTGFALSCPLADSAI